MRTGTTRGDATMLRMGAIFAAVLTLVWSVARGGPLDDSTVPSEAAWMLHVDVERARITPLAAVLRNVAPERSVRAMESVLRGLGLDPCVDVLGLTLYGEDASDGVTLVTCTPAADALAEALAAPGLPGYAFEEIDGLRLHVWGPAGARWVATLAPGRVLGQRRVVVIASSMTRLRRGLQVLGGQRSRPGDEETAPSPLPPRDHAIVVLRLESEKLRQAQEGLFRSDLFRSATRVSLDLGVIPGEPGGDLAHVSSVVYIEGLVQTDSAEAAAQWERAIQVLLGLGGTTERAESWAHAARMASVWADGTKVHLSFRQDVDRVASSLGVRDTGGAGHPPRSGGTTPGGTANVEVGEGR